MRAVRALFGWKPSTVRADLKDILDVMSPGESGFSPEESRMLKNILGLRERRVGDVMVPRADIVAVQQDINIGELVRVFEMAGFTVSRRTAITIPWPGEQVCLNAQTHLLV